MLLPAGQLATGFRWAEMETGIMPLCKQSNIVSMWLIKIGWSSSTWRDPSEWTGLNCSSASFSWFFLLGFLVVLSIKWATNRRPDLSIIAPGQCVARMPGTGPLRRSSVLARKKAIVGKSLVEADRFQRPWVVFVSYWLHALKLLLLGKLGGGQVAQGAMRPALIILDSPLLDNDPGFQQRAKHFPI